MPYDGDSYIHSRFQRNDHKHSHVLFSRYIGVQFSSTKGEQNSVKNYCIGYPTGEQSSLWDACILLVNGLRDVVVGDPFITEAYETR